MLDGQTLTQPSNATLPLSSNPLHFTDDSSYSTIRFSLANGTYSYTIVPVDPLGSAQSGNFTVDGSNIVVQVYAFITAMGCSSSTTSSSTAASSTTSPDGLQLSLSINSADIGVGQNLSVELSVTNTLPTINTVMTSDDWQFQGIPVALWPTCYYPVPAEVVVLQGNYSAQELQDTATSTFTYTCAEAVTFDHVVFQPDSDSANATGVYDVTGSNGTYGPYQLGFSFTTSGYWDLGNLSSAANPPIIDERPPSAMAFVPGVYTVAIEDEWGQVVVLNFTVLGAAT
jgi:hypothetical protein